MLFVSFVDNIFFVDKIIYKQGNIVKLEFDGHQDYQLDAIQAVIAIFEGQPLAKSNFEVS